MKVAAIKVVFATIALFLTASQAFARPDDPVAPPAPPAQKPDREMVKEKVNAGLVGAVLGAAATTGGILIGRKIFGKEREETLSEGGPRKVIPRRKSGRELYGDKAFIGRGEIPEPPRYEASVKDYRVNGDDDFYGHNAYDE